MYVCMKINIMFVSTPCFFLVYSSILVILYHYNFYSFYKEKFDHVPFCLFWVILLDQLVTPLSNIFYVLQIYPIAVSIIMSNLELSIILLILFKSVHFFPS
jgi:hypothetical protein